MSGIRWQEKLGAANWSFWAGLVFFFWVLIALLYLFEYLSAWLQDEKQLPIETLLVSGQQHYVYQADVADALQQQMQQSFFEFDVNQAQQRVEALAWVDRASVRKQWPDIVKVYITEQQPLVHWNGDFLLNQQGEVFQADLARLSKGLAWLYGPEGDEADALLAYRELMTILALYNMQITEMTLTERHALQVMLDNGIALNLGREDWVNRSKRFLQHYPELLQAHQLAYVDLRYDTGFAIGIKDKE